MAEQMEQLRDVSRVVSTPEALAATEFPDDLLVLPLAPDERLVVGTTPFVVPDPHAIVVGDAGWSARWFDAADANAMLDSHCPWDPPRERPSFAQGMVAGLPVKLWQAEERTLVIVPHVFAVEFEERVRP